MKKSPLSKEMYHCLLGWREFMMGGRHCWYIRHNKRWHEPSPEKTDMDTPFTRSFCNKTMLKQSLGTYSERNAGKLCQACFSTWSELLTPFWSRKSLRNPKLCPWVCSDTRYHGCTESMATFLLMRTWETCLYLNFLTCHLPRCAIDLLNCLEFSQQNMLGWTFQS